jgi:hypothetical protein
MPDILMATALVMLNVVLIDQRRKIFVNQKVDEAVVHHQKKQDRIANVKSSA